MKSRCEAVRVGRPPVSPASEEPNAMLDGVVCVCEVSRGKRFFTLKIARYWCLVCHSDSVT